MTEAIPEDAAYWRARHDETRKRLAMLWKAFEDAEARVAELEARLVQFTPVVEDVAAPGRQKIVYEEVIKEVPADEPMLPQPRFPVAVDKLAKIPGITKGDVEKLRTYGINLSDELLHADLSKLSDATGIGLDKLQRWREICELIALKGIGPTWAVRLVDAGVHSIKELGSLRPEDLEKLLLKSYEKQGASEEKMVLFRRTLPSRSKKLVAAAQKAAKSL